MFISQLRLFHEYKCGVCRDESYAMDELPEQLWKRSVHGISFRPLYALGWRFSADQIREKLKAQWSWWEPSQLAGEVFSSAWEENNYWGKLYVLA
jgi:hypothetical protein